MLGEEGRALLPYLRAYRHRVANHVQVAAGWLELGDVEKAREALEALRGRLAAEGRLAAALPEPLAGLILGLALQSEQQGIDVRLEIEAPDAGVPSPAPDTVAAACRAVHEGWARLQAGLSGPRTRPGDRRLQVRWAGGRVWLEAPAAGLPPVVVPVAAEQVNGPEGAR